MEVALAHLDFDVDEPPEHEAEHVAYPALNVGAHVFEAAHECVVESRGVET